MGRCLAIREAVATPRALRALAKKERVRRTALRMLAIANALEGMSRAGVGWAVGIERQSLRDAVIRFNAEGLAGLVDRPHGHRTEVLSDGEQAILVHRVLVGPDPDAASRRAGPCRTSAASSRSGSARRCARTGEDFALVLPRVSAPRRWIASCWISPRRFRPEKPQQPDRFGLERRLPAD